MMQEIKNHSLLPDNLNHKGFIHSLVDRNLTSEVKSLLTLNQACVDETNAYKETALHVAVKKGFSEMVQILIEGQANPNIIDAFGYAPIHIAVNHEVPDNLRLLLKNPKINIDLKTTNQATALMIACSKNNEAGVEILLRQGANVDECNSQKKMAIDFALENQHINIVTLLLSYGAKLPLIKQEIQKDPRMVKTLLTFQNIRNERLSAIQLLRQYNNGNFPTLKQISGLFINRSILKTKNNKLPPELQEYVSAFPRGISFRPWSVLHKWNHTFFPENSNPNQILKMLKQLQVFFSEFNIINIHKNIAEAVDKIEAECEGQENTDQKLLRAQRIYADVLQLMHKSYHPLDPCKKTSYTCQ